MNPSIRESDYIKTWAAFAVCATIGGFIAGFFCRTRCWRHTQSSRLLARGDEIMGLGSGILCRAAGFLCLLQVLRLADADRAFRQARASTPGKGLTIKGAAESERSGEFDCTHG